MNGNIRLVKAIHGTFDEEETRTLCFTLGVEYDDLNGSGLFARVRELVDWCDRHGMTAMLLIVCVEARPNVDWKEVMGKTTVSTPQSFLPKMTSGSASQLTGMQVALLTQRLNRADKERHTSRLLFVAMLVLQVAQLIR